MSGKHAGTAMSRNLMVAVIIGSCLALLAATWLYLAPETLGGSVQFVTTSGDSMSPAFEDGDLALLRTRDRYEPGDIVAFNHPELGMIMHRIVRADGNFYVVKGDNNSEVDAYRPGADEVVGSAWARIPMAGGAIEDAAENWVVILLFGLAGLFVLAPLGIVFPAGARGRRDWLPLVSTSLPRIRPERVAFLLGRTGQVLIAVLAFLAVAGLLLAFIAYNRPLERQSISTVEYLQQTDLTYAAAADGTVYSDGQITTGDPIYRELVDEIWITFGFDVTSGLPVSGDGAYWINARIHGTDGWQRTLPLRTQTPFAGTSIRDTVMLQLSQVDEAIEGFYSQTGLGPDDTSGFTMQVEATASFDGSVGNEVVHTLVDDAIAFGWDSVVLYPQEGNDADAGSTGIGTVEVVDQTANTVNLGAATVPVRSARMIAQALLFLAIFGGIVLWLLMRRALQASEIVQIAARYRSRIVPIQGEKIPAPTRVVALLSFDDLMRISDQKQEPILYLIHQDAHYYYVHADDAIYRVRIEDDGVHRSLTAASDH